MIVTLANRLSAAGARLRSLTSIRDNVDGATDIAFKRLMNSKRSKKYARSKQNAAKRFCRQ